MENTFPIPYSLFPILYSLKKGGRRVKHIKRFFSSWINRVVFLIFAVLIPLNLLTLVLGQRVIADAEAQTTMEIRHTLELYLKLADDALERADTYLALLSIDDPDYLRLRDKPINNEEERYRQLQSVVDLKVRLQKRKEDEFLTSGLYAYFPEKDQFAQSDYYRSAQVRSQILGAIELDPDNPWRRTQLISLDGRAALVSMSRHRGVWYGAWIELPGFAWQIPLEEERILAFTDRDGSVLFATASVPEQLEPDTERVKLGKQSYLISTARAFSGELCLMELVPDRQISGSLPFAIRMLQILSVAALVALPILLLAIQHWMVGPVSRLHKAIGIVEGGDLDYRIPEKEQGTEFNRINRSFNHMMDQVEELKISVYEEQLNSQKIRMGFLAQQIKPHFILNTLNILYSYEQEEYPLIQRMILYLSRYFRYVVNAYQDFVPLGHEMEHLRNYFEIQKVRFVKTFEAVVEYDEDLSDCLIPPLLLQSFAENAIKYALVPESLVEIRVSAEKTEAGRLLLRVTDTGAGISDEVLEKIEEFRKDRTFRPGLGIGIQNAVDRVELLYGGSGSVALRRQETGGTAVEIALPMITVHSRIGEIGERPQTLEEKGAQSE